MIEELFYIEKSAYKDSHIHRLDARVKIICAFSLIIAMVAVPYSRICFCGRGHIFLVFPRDLGTESAPSSQYLVKRLALILPFGLFIIIFQIFFTNQVLHGFPYHRRSAVRHPYLCGVR